ncbi:CDP-glycerol glycerophosphotransferase family protein [Glutamicibacter sp.]|uniref:CDP-glycerol glycerophosphotransferase family protein n=1 Tax=Glutamicibacter sp. TaxID=1931995 RepID=UPI002B475355|nr:CDP-glycerol glycerophosphotransferase family protein [Glutamicibacter sp.]HJX77038.1 CDP-glycerol glycerophosphotransferase family protein [Glutamicibacter sp.]
MALKKHSAQARVQSLVSDLRDLRLKRKTYRYYSGHHSLVVESIDGRLNVEAELNYVPSAIAVLHGRHIVFSEPVISNSQESTDHHHATATLGLDQVLDAWEEYRQLATLHADELDPEEEGEDRSEIEEVKEDDGLPAGTVRLAFTFECEFTELPSAIAWVQVEPQGELLRRKEVKALIEEGELVLSGPVIAHRIMGRFEKTELRGAARYHTGERSTGVYVNKRAEISVGINREVSHSYRIRTDKTQVHTGILSLAGVLDTQTDRLTGARLSVVGRRTQTEFEAPVQLKLDSELADRRFGKATYKWQADLDFASQNWELFDRGDNYDIYLMISRTGSDEERRVRVTRTPYLVRSTTQAGAVHKGTQTLAISPYFTFKAKSTSLILEVYEKEAFAVLEDSRAKSFPILESGSKPIWIVGELSYKAQDNALHLFRYLRSQRQDIEAYYVIDENSPDLRNFASMDNVVFHGSKEHFELATRASRFVGTHHADYLYPTRHQSFAARTRATRVFLQHGVMGTKWMVPNYGKNSPGFTTDLFMVSSEREKQYIVSDFLYSPEDVKVTGLSRFDSLLANDIPTNKNLLLIIPTWRDWLQNEEAFLESAYLQEWKDLLSSPELEQMAAKHSLEVVFSLHPNMQHFREHFQDTPARLIVQGEVDVQELIKTAAVMVTDYSSVAFDFSFLHKPVHYFQFDRARFLGKKGSHLDLDAELPGRIAFDSASLLADLAETMDRGKLMEPRYVQRADVFISHRDQNNSERVTAEIERATLRKRSQDGWKAELPEKLKRRFRRNKRYYSMMRALFKTVSRTPMDENLVVFESGLGKQYGDSPRYIYEELVRSGDTRKKVWIYSGTHRFTDPNTITVERLSPEYFWYLARAKYWVSNQSFPHYLRRRKNGIYLQTWHGTPLKHMALDIEEIHGRDEGYVQRVLNATKQWTHLISPSEYTADIMKSAYSFSGTATDLGYPRNDILMAPDAAAREASIREGLGLAPDVRTVLYAPTFRDDAGTGRGRFRFELPMDLEEFDRRFGEDTVLLLRMHVLVSNAISIPEELNARILDVSGYPDIQELYLATDVLITDYSSVFFDYSLLRRPIVFYAYDLENYRDNLRGFYLDYQNEMPGPIVETEAELWDAVADALEGKNIGGVEREAFVKRFAPYDDGFASRRVVQKFFPPSKQR